MQPVARELKRLLSGGSLTRCLHSQVLFFCVDGWMAPPSGASVPQTKDIANNNNNHKECAHQLNDIRKS